MANCLMLLSRVGQTTSDTSSQSAGGRVFECKTCNRQFPSFQALGGHRASHKKPRLMMGAGGDLLHHDDLRGSPAKPKTHECSICGLEFAIGQALGGHMRRHRAVMSEGVMVPQAAKAVPVMKKSSSRKRFLSLDLNLTPMENDLNVQLWKLSPMVDCL
ncbi:hypothetical protein L1049_013014 [Liquidambar formosana]|uniref:C2H2-type domain-containing protein n=1 Tax=Liquidambar formosana TaxID=63359 RepID=A0AAP0RN36_LIQFO